MGEHPDTTPVADALETLLKVAITSEVNDGERHFIEVKFLLPLAAIERSVTS